MGLNQTQNKVFRHFLEFGSSVFHEIKHDDGLRQYLISSRDETHEKNLGGQIMTKQTKIRPKIRFLPFSQVWFIGFPLNCIG